MKKFEDLAMYKIYRSVNLRHISEGRYLVKGLKLD